MNKLKQLNLREQILGALVIFVLLFGSYSLFRLIPKFNVIENKQKQAEATQKKLIATELPDEPKEDIETITKQIEDIEQAMALEKEEVSLITARLASLDSQELKVRISRLAREAGIQIRVNEPVNMSPQQPIQKSSNKKIKNNKPPIVTQELILPETAGWIARMSKDTMFYRPMQRLEIEGDYQSIQAFIYGLDNLPWIVTVLNLKIQKIASIAPYGYSQTLSAELILSL